MCAHIGGIYLSGAGTRVIVRVKTGSMGVGDWLAVPIRQGKTICRGEQFKIIL